jgi:RNA polymerase sigma-70 factor, ECF subfamily
MVWGRNPLAEPEPLIRRVYAYVAYRIGPGPDAEDITSETFERAVRYSTSYDATKGDPVAWLIGIARRCIDQQRPTPAGVPLDESRDAALDDVEEHVVRRVTLADAASELSDRDRELLALYYAGLSGADIAELMGVRRNVIDVALHRALGRVRAVLEREPEMRASTL